MKTTDVETLPDALLRQVSARAPVRSLPRNAIVVIEGDDSDSLCVMLSGRVKVFVSGEDGRELEINRIGPGACFGEVILDGGPRSASVMALKDCRCAVIQHADVSRFLAEVPQSLLVRADKVIE